MDFVLAIKFMYEWVKERIVERSTLDGSVLVAAGVAFLLFKSVAVFAAWIAIAWGLYTMWKAEK